MAPARGAVQAGALGPARSRAHLAHDVVEQLLAEIRGQLAESTSASTSLRYCSRRTSSPASSGMIPAKKNPSASIGAQSSRASGCDSGRSRLIQSIRRRQSSRSRKRTRSGQVAAVGGDAERGFPPGRVDVDADLRALGRRRSPQPGLPPRPRDRTRPARRSARPWRDDARVDRRCAWAPGWS